MSIIELLFIICLLSLIPFAVIAVIKEVIIPLIKDIKDGVFKK